MAEGADLLAERLEANLRHVLARWVTMTPAERDASPLKGTPDEPGIFDAAEGPAGPPEWYAWDWDPRDPEVALIVAEPDLEEPGGPDPLELIVEEDLSIDRVGGALCEDLAVVRDELLDAILESARNIEIWHALLSRRERYRHRARRALPDPAMTAEGGVLNGLILALGLVLGVDLDEARRQALRAIAGDRVRRAA